MPGSKTGLMYSDAFANYKAADGYLCMSAGFSPWMATNDYYDTPERVTEARDLLEKSGLMDKLTPVKAVKADKEALIGFHSREYIDKLERLSAEQGGEVGELCQIGPGASTSSARPWAATWPRWTPSWPARSTTPSACKGPRPRMRSATGASASAWSTISTSSLTTRARSTASSAS